MITQRNKPVHLYRLFFLLISCVIFSCSENNFRNIESDGAEIPENAMHALNSEKDLDVLLDEIGDAKIVLLGEASHGTSEFYTWRDAISRRLISEKGFNIIAVEEDWTDTYPINTYIRGNSNYNTAEEALQNFDRWPQWMWANEEVADMAEWLRSHNSETAMGEETGFYGIDVYGIWESIQVVHRFLERTNPAAAEKSRAVLECFAPYNQNGSAYARATLNSSEDCTDEMADLMEAVENTIAERPVGDEASFNALQNTRVIVHAESYYRAAARSNATSWNIRDLHMAGTIDRLLEHHGTGSKIIVWEHNTHVGDARATDMADAGMVNVGQLARERYGIENVHITGFGTYRGKVIAAERWDSPGRTMNVPNAQRNSWEWLLHRQGPSNKIIFTHELDEINFYQQRIGHRAIGVVYDPYKESGNYVPSVIPERYDAFIFIDKTTALSPL